MEGVHAYLLRLVGCGLICGIAIALTEKKGSLGKLMKLITGIFMLITIVSPVLEFEIGSYEDIFGKISAEADALTQESENLSAAALEDIIKTKTQAYILDKAKSFGADLTVEVSLGDGQIPVPSAVRVTGSISPYGKKQLQKIISEDLGIALEDQTWIG